MRSVKNVVATAADHSEALWAGCHYLGLGIGERIQVVYLQAENAIPIQESCIVALTTLAYPRRRTECDCLQAG
jgi:hypothetical protein